MNTLQNLINELAVIRSATHTQSDYRAFTICIEKAKEYLMNDSCLTVDEAAEKSYPSTVNPDTGDDENWYNKKVWKEGAMWAMESKVDYTQENDSPILCEYCGYLIPDHEEKCLKSPETKAQLLINEHLKFNDNENAAICHSLITVNMVKAVLGNGDFMAYYSHVRQLLIKSLTSVEINNVQPPNDMQCGVGKNNI